MSAPLVLVSHPLCPYVQRAAIALAEKGTPFERITVDLAERPDWFVALSPLGKVPLLRVGESVIFESAVILEYLEDTVAPALHPADPLRRAEHRAWIEFGSALLGDIAGFYNAPDRAALDGKAAAIGAKFARLDDRFAPGPWFDGDRFSLVDAVFAPVFRYLDAFERIDGIPRLADRPKLAGWRAALAARPSVRQAVAPDYPDRLWAFLAARPSALGRLVAPPVAAA